MFLIAFFLVGLLTVPLAGGRLRALADVRLRWPGLVIAALAVQIVIISIVPGGSGQLHEIAHLGSYAVVGAFVVANLARVPYLWLLAAGGACNFIAIVANGGVMPASAHALDVAGRTPAAGEFVNSGVVDGARVAFLGDVFAMPASWPLANVFSVGDVLLALGALLALHRLCLSRLGRLRPVVVAALAPVPAPCSESTPTPDVATPAATPVL